ncbi:MAG: two-component system chemotaxis sensor kinase CheA, partial [Thermoproteota archaeon]
LTFFDKSKALEAVSVLKKKSLIFLFFTLALATILSVFSSSKITASLRNLFFATQEISKGNFNIDLDIKSNDEVGMLARSFNFMSKEILKLLTELKVYNEQLEELVDERTKELNQALRLQKAMVDSLDQGFFIFNDKAQILPVTSKASLEHFGQEPAGKNLTEVLKMSEAQGSEFVDFCDTMFAELLPFQDCVGLAPDIHKQENRTITLNYHPMRSETNEIEGVVLVSTDKTEELKAQHQAELDRAVSQMIMSISRDKFQFSKLLTNTKELLTKVEVMISGDESDFDIDDLFRYVHTLKGNLSLYHMKDLVNILHEIESRIISFQKGEIDIEHPVTENDVQMINLQFLKFFNTYGKVLGFKDFNSLDAKRSISEVALKDFYQILKENNSPEVLSAYENKFYFKKVEEIFTYMNHVIEQTSNITGKKVMPIQIDGGHHCIDYERYQNFFSSLVHAFRNAVDHGIETPIKRKENEKSETGKINVSYECKKNLHTFKIIDDGSGIDPTSIKEKLIKLDIRFDENLSDEELIQFIFHAGFSTNTKTTLISGRGVGMDTIKAEVLKLNGKITVHSQLKIGTEIHIQFPV